MTWLANFQCLNCEHSWWEPAPADAWEMIIKVGATTICPLCGAKMRESRVELLSHRDANIGLLCTAPYVFTILE